MNGGESDQKGGGMVSPNGNAATATVKALGQSPALLALVVLVGVLLYVFGERISSRLDRLEAKIDCVVLEQP